MPKTWGQRHNESLARISAAARAHRKGTGGTTDRRCRDCDGSGRLNKVHARGKCTECDGNGYKDKTRRRLFR